MALTQAERDSLQFTLQKLSADDVSWLGRLLNDRHRAISAEAVSTFAPGDRVTFPGPGGLRVEGVVVKRNRKTVTVREADGHTWRVGGSLLQAAVE